jgi:ABC-type Co2+ transport system permease subunit
MDFTELLKVAYGSANFPVFGMLNVVVAVSQHLAIVSNRWAFGIAAAIGALIGSMGAAIEAQATVGLATAALMNAALLGGITGAGASTLVGFAVVKGLATVGVFPVSEAKILAEAIRDPMNPTTAQPK